MRGCGKRQYGSARDAKRKSHGIHNRIRVYYCVVCRAWHVTNSEPIHDDYVRDSVNGRQRMDDE